MVMELLFMALMGEPSGLMRVQETISSAVEKILAYVPASLHGDVPLLKEHLVFQCHVSTYRLYVFRPSTQSA